MQPDMYTSYSIAATTIQGHRQNPDRPTPRSNHYFNVASNLFTIPSLLIPHRPRRLLILPQTRQQLPKPFLARPARPAPRPLPAQIHQFRNALPARAACGGVFTTGEKFLGFFARLGDGLVFFLVVVFVKVVDGGLRRFDRFGFLGGGDFGAVGQVMVTAFAPLSVGEERVSLVWGGKVGWWVGGGLPDGFGLFFLGAVAAVCGLGLAG